MHLNAFFILKMHLKDYAFFFLREDFLETLIQKRESTFNLAQSFLDLSCFGIYKVYFLIYCEILVTILKIVHFLRLSLNQGFPNFSSDGTIWT